MRSACLQRTHFILICDAFHSPDVTPRHPHAVFLASEHRRERSSARAFAPARGRAPSRLAHHFLAAVCEEIPGFVADFMQSVTSQE